MSNQTIPENVNDLTQTVRKYVQARIDLIKVELLEKVIRTGTYFFAVISLIIAISFIVFSLTLAFSYWYGKNIGDVAGGFLISAGFYLVLAIIIYFFRRQIFANNIVRNMSRIFFTDKDK